ncbi:MAG: translation initiation factor IF-6 [Candidatus Micrarchaeota archaeon]
MKQTSYYGHSWIGMFIKGNDDITLVPIDAVDKMIESIEENLKTKVVKIVLAQSNLIGVYTVMNSNGVVLPAAASSEEVAKIKELGLNVYVSHDRHNAFGNNIVVNNKGGVINPEIEQAEVRRLSDVLGVELVPGTIAKYLTVGSCCIATDNGFLAHYGASEQDMEWLENALKVKGALGTANTGSGFVAYGMVANNKGCLAGEASTVFELGRLLETMGLV